MAKHPERPTIVTELSEREVVLVRAAQRHAVAWLLDYADAHAGKWAGMEPREALKDAAQKMEAALGC
jgi:hypothetical protein